MTATIRTTGFNILAHAGFTFRSANEMSHILSRKEAAALRSQPGYRRGSLMTIRFAGDSARLYTKVGREWMDASLGALSA